MSNPIIAIVGPTASGKTVSAICVARKIDGEILSMDSMQIYRGMDIGTAKAEKEELEMVPHHLLSIIQPDENFSVAIYQKLARRVLKEIQDRNRIPVFCGGTGLYLQSMEHPLSFGDEVSENKECIMTNLSGASTDRESLKGKSSQDLYSYLYSIDPDAALHLHINDRQRVIRAIEIYEHTHVPYSRRINEWKTESTENWLKFGLFWPREKLNKRIDERVEQMFSNGLIDEVKALLAHGISENEQSMNAIGYKETYQFLKKDISLSEAKERTKHRTRQYAKRQMTWFKRDPTIEWIAADTYKNEEDIHTALLEKVEEGLSRLKSKSI